MRWIAKTLCLGMMACVGQKAWAQDQQLWLDYQVDYPFANQYLFEMTTSYQTVLSSEKKWRALSVSPLLEYQLLTRLDLQVGIPVAYTAQTQDYNSFEFNPYLGARIYITQNKRIESRLIVKQEKRFFRNIDEGVWESSNRTRLKGEIWVAINGPNIYQDKLWYAILDYEEFFVMDEQVNERFANRRRGRLGACYRLSYKHRFELLYTVQSSRDEVHGEFNSVDGVLQLRYKMFLNPAKPKPD